MTEMPYKHITKVGENFYNIRGPFKILFGLLDIGTHMSLAKVNDKFIVFDTVNLSVEMKAELDHLTNNGADIECVIATHPFHTMSFKPFHTLYPNAKYYGTPRHVRNITDVPWQEKDITDCKVQAMYQPDIEIRIPSGAEFVDPKPELSNHFASAWVFHKPSQTIHVDDTVHYFAPGSLPWFAKLVGIKEDRFIFHRSINGPGLLPSKEAPLQFKAWLEKVVNDWEFQNICCAHRSNKIGGAKPLLQDLLAHFDFDKLAADPKRKTSTEGAWGKSETECG